MIAWTKSGAGNISLVLLGRQYYVNVEDAALHSQVLQALKDDMGEQELVDLVDCSTRIQKHLELHDDRLRIEDGAIIYRDEDGDDEQVHGTIVDRLLSFVNEDLPVTPLVNFVKKLMQNPSMVSAHELYDFLDHKSLPICEDGDFLAYKVVTNDYKDKYSRTKDNTVGATVTEVRRKVDDNRKNGCSKGLHAGTLEYVQSFGHFEKDEDGEITPSSDKVIIVKINPKHVVSVPLCTDCQKLRTEEYSVLRDYDGEMEYSLASNDGLEYEENDIEDDWYEQWLETEDDGLSFIYSE